MIEETGGCTYSAPRDADGNLLPTRWRSDRYIDWLMISEPDVPIDIWADDAFVGDHRLVWAKIQVPCGFHHAREYKPTGCFRRPLDVEEKTWRQALASEFEDFSDNDLGDAELEWAYLNGELQKRLLRVYDALGRQAPSLQRCRDKGSEVAWFPEGQTTKTWSKRGTFLLRKLSKWLGRAKEAQRQRLQGHVNDQLEHTVVHTWPECVPHSLGQDGFLSLDKAVEAGELALEEERRRQRDGFLRQWRLNMEAEGKAATKWLHNKPFLSAQGVVVPNGDGSVHRTFDVEEAFELILGQWRRIWHRREAVPEMIEADGGDLRRPGRAEPQVWSLRAADLYASAQRRRGGSGSFDGWTGDEFAALPHRFWEEFLYMLRRWMQRNFFPKAMQCYKQVFLPNASLDEGDTAPGDTRPISIGCVLNCVVSGAMLLHPSCQRWIQGLVPGQMHGALKGRNLEAGIVILEQWRHSDSVLLSLDLRKGFDYADANHSLKVLEHYGFCDEWLRYLTGVWERQLRFSQIEPYVTSVPEVVRRSLPQGDPLAPLAFCLLLVPAAVATSQGNHVAQAFFVGDRN